MSSAFEQFWAHYPRKEGKAACLKKWDQMRLDDKAGMIVAHVAQRAKDDKKWQSGYTPMPLTFLNQSRWEDEYEKIAPKLPPPSKSSTPEVTAPWPQQCPHKATLNLVMLSILRQTGGVDTDTLREMVRLRNRIAGDLREMWGNGVNRQDWAEMVPGIVKQFKSLVSQSKLSASASSTPTSPQPLPSRAA